MTIGRVARDTFTVSTDDAIQQFVDAFVDLKTRLRERMDLQSWKIAVTTKDGVLQLSEYVKRLKDIGEVAFVPWNLLSLYPTQLKVKDWKACLALNSHRFNGTLTEYASKIRVKHF